MNELGQDPDRTTEDDLSTEQPEPADAELLDALLDADVEAAPAVSRQQLAGPRLRVGWLVSAAQGELRVDFAGNARGPLAARTTVPLDAHTLAEAMASGRGVVLMFEDHRPDAPIITGLLQDPVAAVNESPEPPAVDSSQAQPQARSQAEPASPRRGSRPEAMQPEAWRDEAAPSAEFEAETGATLEAVEARVDGRRVELEAADEIVLRCGKASIVLRRNGRVVIRGTYVETRSRGVNRVKGGSVEIN